VVILKQKICDLHVEVRSHISALTAVNQLNEFPENHKGTTRVSMAVGLALLVLLCGRPHDQNLRFFYDSDGHGSLLVGSSEQKMNSIDSSKKLTPTPRVHCSRKHPITEQKDYATR